MGYLTINGVDTGVTLSEDLNLADTHVDEDGMFWFVEREGETKDMRSRRYLKELHTVFPTATVIAAKSPLD